MDWLKIGSALFLIAMLFMIFPRARKVIKNTPKVSAKDWMGYILPLSVVILFVILMMAMV
ncbi:MAG: hypothetical protein IIC09_02460 [Proteobacteria bacterium]|nr:hypothetical protein [Pseudomonadota bacterium]